MLESKTNNSALELVSVVVEEVVHVVPAGCVPFRMNDVVSNSVAYDRRVRHDANVLVPAFARAQARIDVTILNVWADEDIVCTCNVIERGLGFQVHGSGSREEEAREDSFHLFCVSKNLL